MKLIASLLTGVLALISFGIGGAYFFLGPGFLEIAGGFDFSILDGKIEYAAIDNTLRFMAGLWILIGAGLVYCLMDFNGRGTVLTILLAGFFLGGIGRLLSAMQFGMPEPMIVPTIIELVLPPIILLLGARSRVRARAHV